MFVAGGLATLFLLPSPVPASIVPKVTVSNAPATDVKTNDPQGVSLKVTASPAIKLASASSGIVTRNTCVPGASATSGTSGLAVNGAPLLYLATEEPLWRDISVGASGSDVHALQAELIRLGQSISADGSFGSDTLSALKNLATQAGLSDAKDWQSLPQSRVIWIPAPSVTMASCDAQIGQELAAAGSIATLTTGVSAASISPLPSNLMPGDRVVLIDDQRIVVDGTGAISSASDLARLAASTAYRKYQAGTEKPAGDGAQQGSASGGAGMSVQYELAQPITVVSVPAAAVHVKSGDSACVVSDGEAIAVRVVGSQLGETFVMPQDGKRLGKSVAVGGNRSHGCE